LFMRREAVRKYCSHACFTTGRRVRRPELTCPTCQGIFRPRNPKNPNKFCSRVCASRSRQSVIAVNRFHCEPV
jgi:tRNA (Thr-GGU) A37 N-methylase